MSALDRLVCVLRRHSWEEHSDPAGTVVFCSRCGKLRHVPDYRDPDVFNYQGPAPYQGGPPGSD